MRCHFSDLLINAENEFIICGLLLAACLCSVGLFKVLNPGLFLFLLFPCLSLSLPLPPSPKSTYYPWAISFTLWNLIIPARWWFSQLHLRSHLFPEPQAHPSNWLMGISIGMFFKTVHNWALQTFPSRPMPLPLFLALGFGIFQFHKVSVPPERMFLKTVFSSLPPSPLPGPSPSLTCVIPASSWLVFLMPLTPWISLCSQSGLHDLTCAAPPASFTAARSPPPPAGVTFQCLDGMLHFIFRLTDAVPPDGIPL